MAKKRGALFLIIALAGVCCVLAIGAGAAYTLLRPTGETWPAVVFHSPTHGDTVEVGQDVTVHAVAQQEGQGGVTRLELWIDGELVETQTSAIEGGTSPFPLTARWQPATAGDHVLIARAFNAGGTRVHASITVEAAGSADGDGDEVADAADACPGEPGSRAADGCPDRDRDGIPDSEDACPDEAGMPAGDGCPTPSEGDRDGDGLSDELDACPDEAGAPRSDGCPDADGDGIPDAEDACPADPGLDDTGCLTTDDRDEDGIPDDEDACPDEPGSPETAGCPDRDGDGTPDAEDPCPDEPGPPGSPAGDGCPSPAEGDRDGDGFPDDEDECPDEPGTDATWGCPDRDGDGVRDDVDECPDEPGPPENRGCPAEEGGGSGPGEEDSDGDGTPDPLDPCPDEPGPPEHDGCPDSDGDGIPDWWDICDDEPGPPETIGCPDTGDSDGDGVPDDADPCPEEPGLPEHDGCPPPGGGGDDDGDGIPDDEEPPGRAGIDLGDLLPARAENRWPVEFQLIRLEVTEDYSHFSCYTRLGGEEVRRISFVPSPGNEREWIGNPFLITQQLAAPMGEPLEIYAECGADVVFLGTEGGWGTYFDLGSYTASHPSTEWDGHVIHARSAGGSDGRWAEADYRLCLGSCESAAFSPPVASLYHFGGDAVLTWTWDGNPDYIDGFKIYSDGSHVLTVPADQSSQSVLSYRPSCGSERRLFHVTAYRDDLESPFSNPGYWTPNPCPRVVQVTFDRLYTGNLGDDEWWAHGESVGPIYGHFRVVGSRSHLLSFHAADYGDWWGERDDGYRLRHNRTYVVQDIFNWIQTQMAGCLGSGCSVYNGPESSTVTVELGAYESLTFGGLIRDVDSDNPDDTLFEDSMTLRPGEVLPGRYTILDRHVQLDVLIDVLVGPEAGDQPDLVIRDVTAYEGQLRVHVFNNAAALDNSDVTLSFSHISDNQLFDVRTWEGISIPTGGERILQSGELLMEPYDLRVVVDPDNDIDEMDEGNNIYETPVRMRVEFIRVHIPHCNENGCSIFDCDSEHAFNVWAGHGTDRNDATWVGYNVRFPRSGDLIACGHDICQDDRSPEGDWYMEGDERYTFEFDMPADDSLFVIVTGREHDWTNNNDSLGDVSFAYDRWQGWGARDEVYEASYGRQTPCDDTFCIACRNGLTAWWRITRVR